MQSSFYKTVLDKTVIPIAHTRAKDAIDRLRQLNTASQRPDDLDDTLFVSCSKKGRVRVSPDGYSSAYLQGDITEENGKTALTVYAVHDRSRLLIRIAVAVFCILICTILLYLEMSFALGRPFFWISVGFLVVDIIDSLLCLFHAKQYQEKGYDQMENELRKRIDIIEKWEK